jgi:hypothetical protein
VVGACEGCDPTVVTVRPGESPAPRGAVWAWALAGVLWALIWFHGTQTHGLTAKNEMRLWLGSTWMDSSKLLCLPFAVVAVSLYLLGRDARVGRVARWLWVLLLLVTAVQAVAVLAGNSPFPWGSYELTFEELEESDQYPAVVSKGGIAQAMASLIGTLLFVPVGIALVRARRVPWWTVPAAVIGMLFTFFTTPASWIPAVGWFLVSAGVALKRRSARGHRQVDAV